MEVFGRFKDLADKKKEIFEEDLIALAGERTLTYDEHIKFVSLEVNAGSLSKHQAKLTLIMDDKKQSNTPPSRLPAKRNRYLETVDMVRAGERGGWR